MDMMDLVVGLVVLVGVRLQTVFPVLTNGA